jgi:hypothetical protein
MDLISCRKRLFVAFLMLSSMSSSQLVKSAYTKEWFGIINDVYHPYSCGEVHLRASKQIVSQSFLVGASFQHSFKCNYAITSIAAWIVFEQHCCLDCLWTTLPPAMIWMLVHLFILNKVFLCHYQMLNITLMDFDDSSSDSFFAPSWSEYCLFSFLGSTVLPSGGQRFKECREMLMSFLSRILQTQSMFLFENLSCSGIKSHIFKDHVYSKSSCWDEIRDVSFFEGLLKKKNNSSFFGQRPNTRYSM